MALAALGLLLSLSFAAASSQAATTSTGQQESRPPAELEEGEPPGEQEAAPTEAERQNPTKPVTTLHELPSLRTESSDTYLLSDGAYSQRIANQPINFKSGDGSWQPIEDQLVQQSDGTWQPQAAPVPISLPASLGSGSVSIGSGKQQLSFSLEGASGQEGTPAGASRVYRDAVPDTDVTYALTPQALRETLTLASASAPTVYRYKLNFAPGLSASQQQDGTVLIEDTQGQTVYTLTPPSATDANPDQPFPSHAPVRYELSDDGSTLSLIVDKGWLEDPNRVFPVTIDPEAWIKTSPDCSIISAGFANTDECGGALYVGPDYPTASEGIARSLLYFETSCIPKASVIVGSSLHLYFHQHSGSSTINVEAHALEEHTFAWGATWNKYDGTNAWTNPGGDFNKAIAGERVVKPTEEGKELQIGFTPQVEQWVRDSTSNHGILLKAQNETVAGYDTFAQSGNVEHLPEPTLEVIYEPRLGIPPMGQVYQQGLAFGATMSVNVANGNLYLASPDVNFSTPGYDTELGRSYNSQDDLLEGASMGNWRLNKGDDDKLYGDEWDGAVDFYGTDGSDTRFDRAPWADNHPAAGDKAFTGEAGFNEGLLQHEGGTRTLFFPGGVEWKTDSKLWSVPTEIVDPGGEGTTLSLSYTYESGEHLTEVKDTHGHTLTITHEAGTHRITKIEGKKGEDWKYAYKEGRLITFTNSAKEKAKYTYYKTSGMLESIEDPSGTWVVSYDEQNRASSLRKIVNGTIKKAGSEDEMTKFSYETEQTTVTNPLGTPSVYYYDEFGNVLEEPATAEAAAEFYAEYAGIESGAARADIDLQDHASILDSQLDGQLGTNYTGEWFDPTSKHIKLGLTSEGYERTVEQDLDNLGLADNADIVPTTSSWAQLEAGEETLASSLASLQANRKISLGLDPQHNAVQIVEANDLSPSEVNEVSEARSKLTVTSEIVARPSSSVGATPGACRVGACDKPLRGGVRIRTLTESGECTGGFVARSPYTGKHFLLTAGHCIKETGGISTAWVAKYHELGESEAEADSRTTKLKALGPAYSYVEGNSFEGALTTTKSKGDFGMIELPPEDFWGSPLAPIVVVYGNSELPRNEGYGIIGTQYNEQEPKQQLVVCTGGVTEEHSIPETGEDCGLVLGLQHTTTYEEGTVIHNLTEMDVCVTPHEKHLHKGASGAPVYRAHYAVGIWVGWEGACTDLYEGINTAEKVLGVNVLR